MGRKLSKQQKSILEGIKDSKCRRLDVFQIAGRLGDRILVSDRIHSGVRAIHNLNGIYRMMKNLENRGYVATLLGRRPRVWYLVEWKNDEPEIDLCGEAAQLLRKKGHFVFRTRGQRYVRRIGEKERQDWDKES